MSHTRREWLAKWREKHREEIREYNRLWMRDKRANDPDYYQRELAQQRGSKMVHVDWVRMSSSERAKMAGRKQTTLQIDIETYEALLKVASKKKVSVNELIRTYVEWGLENDEVWGTDKTLDTSRK